MISRINGYPNKNAGQDELKGRAGRVHLKARASIRIIATLQAYRIRGNYYAAATAAVAEGRKGSWVSAKLSSASFLGR